MEGLRQLGDRVGKVSLLLSQSKKRPQLREGLGNRKICDGLVKGRVQRSSSLVNLVAGEDHGVARLGLLGV